MAIPKIYQCNYEQNISMPHSQMSIGMASLIFFIYMEKSMRKRSVLNDLLKTLKNIYFSSKSGRSSDLRISGSNFTMKVENIDERTRHIHLKQKKLTESE
jgi:hypothetical protein